MNARIYVRIVPKDTHISMSGCIHMYIAYI
jgi:hypothetical protein